MINNKIREAIYLLPEEGMSLRKISRTLNVSKNTVISIIKQKGGIMNKVRKDKIKIDSGLLEALYADCEGRIQRIYVKEGRRNLIIQNLKIIPFFGEANLLTAAILSKINIFSGLTDFFKKTGKI